MNIHQLFSFYQISIHYIEVNMLKDLFDRETQFNTL
jgi:hypothetical protein